MKHLKIISATVFAAVFFYSMLPLTIQAAQTATAGQGRSLTLPQLLIFGIVMGWYLYNHFKDKIRALFTKKQKP
jgi:hypothetical protein